MILGYLLSDRLGRRLTILIAICIYLVGQIILVASVAQGQFIAARVINGFGAGALFQTMSLYTAEIAPPQVRGRMTALLNTGIGLGLMIAYWVQYGTANINGTGAWRLPLGLQLIPAAMVGVHIFFRPESPRWLVRHEKDEQALKVLARLHAHGDTDNSFVKAELSEIQIAVEFEKGQSTPSYFQLLFTKKYRRRTALGMGAQFLQQISGINIILYYASKVFAQSGASGTSAVLLANGISGALLFVSSLQLNIMMDTYGRRKPLIGGPFAMGVCLVIVGSMLVKYGNPYFDATTQAVNFSFKQTPAAGHAAIAFMFLYVVFFGGFYSSVPWTYPNEVWGIEARARGTAMSTATNWFTNFWLGLYIPTALNEASWKLYYIFAGFCFLSAILAFLFFPETAGRPLEELELLFLPSRNPFVFMDKEATTKRSFFADFQAEGDATVAGDQLGKALGVEHTEKIEEMAKA